MADIITDIITDRITDIIFKGGKINKDTRIAVAGTIGTIHSYAVGMDAGDYIVVIAPAGTVVVDGQEVAKFKLETPKDDLVNNVTVLLHTSHVKPAPIEIEESK